MSNGGQRTFKLFFCELLSEYLKEEIDVDDYHLHHIDGNHENNKIDNLSLMLAKDHRSLHGRVKGKTSDDYSKRLKAEFISMQFAGKTYYVKECLKHIFDMMTSGLKQDVKLDEAEVKESRPNEEDNIN